MDSIIIRIIDMPLSLRGATVKDENGDYNMYLNARLSDEERVKAYRHEIEHIRQGHFYQERPVADLEREARHGEGNEDKKREVDHTGVRVHGRSREGTL